ncbi:hypothetical protein ACFV1W_40080 [Kitasatospora sp. NPDC059648]|uniref:hypothetical protein n=1 Tax=Kitasatospora sp. NPDC059648 TaxID=3346894 RepID=UPI00369A7EA0
MHPHQGEVVIVQHHLSQPGRGVDHHGPARVVQEDLVGGTATDRVLHRAVGGAEARHQLDLLLGAKAPAQEARGLVRIAEVVEEHVHGVVEILELVPVEPYFPLPGRAGQGHDRRDDMEPEVREGDAVINHGQRLLIALPAGRP